MQTSHISKYKVAITFFLFFVCSINRSFSQLDYTHVGAQNAGMAFSCITNADFWAAYNNPANLSRIENVETGLMLKNLYGLQEMNIIAMGFASKYNNSASGFTYIRHGSSVYSQHVFGLPISVTFLKIFSLGAKFHYIYTNDVQDVFLKHDFKADFGAAIHFKKLRVAYHSHFIALRSHYAVTENTSKNTLGVSYLIAETVDMHFALERYFEQNRIALGANFKLFEYLSLMAGLSTYYEFYSAGISLNMPSFNLSFSVTGVENLGLSPYIGLTKRF